MVTLMSRASREEGGSPGPTPGAMCHIALGRGAELLPAPHQHLPLFKGMCQAPGKEVPFFVHGK